MSRDGGGAIKNGEQGLLKLVGAGWTDGQATGSLWANLDYLLSSCTLISAFTLSHYWGRILRNWECVMKPSNNQAWGSCRVPQSPAARLPYQPPPAQPASHPPPSAGRAGSPWPPTPPTRLRLAGGDNADPFNVTKLRNGKKGRAAVAERTCGI